MFDETCEALGVFKCAILEQSYQINLCLCFKKKRSDSGTVVNPLKKCVIGTVFLYQIVLADTKTSCRHRKWRKWIRASLVSTQRIYIFFFTKQIKLNHIKLRLCWNLKFQFLVHSASVRLSLSWFWTPIFSRAPVPSSLSPLCSASSCCPALSQGSSLLSATLAPAELNLPSAAVYYRAASLSPQSFQKVSFPVKTDSSSGAKSRYLWCHKLHSAYRFDLIISM